MPDKGRARGPVLRERRQPQFRFSRLNGLRSRARPYSLSERPRVSQDLREVQQRNFDTHLITRAHLSDRS